jgi:hypothetical protein
MLMRGQHLLTSLVDMVGSDLPGTGPSKGGALYLIIRWALQRFSGRRRASTLG